MEVHFRAPGRPDLVLLRPQEFTALKLVAHGDRDGLDALGDMLGSNVRVEPGGEHVFLDPAVLKDLAGRVAEDSEWQGNLDSMVAFAASRGWVSDGRIRLHCDWTDPVAETT